MRASLPCYELVAPRNLEAALEILGREPGVWRPFAGGTDLMVLLEAGKLPHRKFLSIWKFAELRGIEATSESLSIGALSTYTDIQRNDILQREFPLLCRAASETGSIATQNRGTIGGNIANASPAADSPPALLVYDAEIELISAKGTRRMSYSDFHTGYKKNADARRRADRPRSPQTHVELTQGILSEGGNAKGAGDFENMLCCRRER